MITSKYRKKKTEGLSRKGMPPGKGYSRKKGSGGDAQCSKNSGTRTCGGHNGKGDLQGGFQKTKKKNVPQGKGKNDPGTVPLGDGGPTPLGVTMGPKKVTMTDQPGETKGGPGNEHACSGGEGAHPCLTGEGIKKGRKGKHLSSMAKSPTNKGGGTTKKKGAKKRGEGS